MGTDGEDAEGRQPAGAGGAVLSEPSADASLRAEQDAARPQRRTQHQVQPGIPVHGGEAAGQGRVHRRAGDHPRRAAPGTHRLRGHRRRPARGTRLAARAGRGAAARVPAFRGRTVADRGATTGRCPHPAGQPAAAAGRAAHRDPRRDRPRTSRRAASVVPGRGGLPARPAGRRGLLPRAVHRPHHRSRDRLGPAVGPIPRPAHRHQRKAGTMTRTRTALIIGGGVAGPAIAMALQKAGLDSVIYEAHPGSAEGIGAFLTLASNGVDALHVIDADTPALAAGFPTPAIVLRSGTGKYWAPASPGCRRAWPARPSSAPTSTRRCTRRRAAAASASSTASAWSTPRRPARGYVRCSPTARRPPATWSSAAPPCPPPPGGPSPPPRPARPTPA